MKKELVSKLGAGIGLMLALALPIVVLGQSVPGGTIYLTGKESISRLVESILRWIGGIVFFIAIIMLLWSAILFLTGGGSEDQIKKAKSYLIYAIIGIAVAVLAYSVEPFIRGFLGGGYY